MGRIKRMKEKIVENYDLIFVGGLYITLMGACAAIGYYGIKQQQEVQKKLEEAIGRGDTILPNPDGSFWIVSKG